MDRKARETVMKRSGMMNGQGRWTVQNVNHKYSFNSRQLLLFLNKITIHLKIESKQKKIKIFTIKKNISPS